LEGYWIYILILSCLHTSLLSGFYTDGTDENGKIILAEVPEATDNVEHSGLNGVIILKRIVNKLLTAVIPFSAGTNSGIWRALRRTSGLHAYS
jgi:hypothetical protein